MASVRLAALRRIIDEATERLNRQDQTLEHLGTLGTGNHFVEICASTRRTACWMMLHSGSRGIGNRIGTPLYRAGEERAWSAASSACRTRISPTCRRHPPFGALRRRHARLAQQVRLTESCPDDGRRRGRHCRASGELPPSTTEHGGELPSQLCRPRRTTTASERLRDPQGRGAGTAGRYRDDPSLACMGARIFIVRGQGQRGDLLLVSSRHGAGHVTWCSSDALHGGRP